MGQMIFMLAMLIIAVFGIFIELTCPPRNQGKRRPSKKRAVALGLALFMLGGIGRWFTEIHSIWSVPKNIIYPIGILLVGGAGYLGIHLFLMFFPTRRFNALVLILSSIYIAVGFLTGQEEYLLAINGGIVLDAALFFLKNFVSTESPPPRKLAEE